jgi:DedD protein
VNRQAYSRSERRMERRQVLILLLLVVATGLGCFALGVMVGRNAAPQAMANQEVTAAAPRIPVAAAPPANEPPAVEGKTPPAADAPANLTFYDDLPRGAQPPLGSGINLPPAAAPEPPAPQPAPSSAALTSKPAAPTPVPPPAPAPKPARTPAAASGSYVVQVASFGSPDDAGVLQARLAKKGMEAYVQQANLGSKGIWYRVFVGPLASSTAAQQVAARLKAEEKLSPLVRKR